MTQIESFKLEAKNLFKDFKSKTQKHFPIHYERVLDEYKIDPEDFSLMKAQHVIAQIAGFNKWTDLIQAPESELQKRQLWEISEGDMNKLLNEASGVLMSLLVGPINQENAQEKKAVYIGLCFVSRALCIRLGEPDDYTKEELEKSVQILFFLYQKCANNPLNRKAIQTAIALITHHLKMDNPFLLIARTPLA